MTGRKHSFEGATIGSTITGAEAGSGDSLGTVTVTGGSTIVADAAHVMHGSKAAKVTPAAAGQAYMGWTGLSSTSLAFRAYYYFTANTTDDTVLLQCNASGVRAFSMSCSATGKLTFAQSGSGTAVWVAAAAMLLANFVRIEAWAQPNATTAAAGTFRAAYYNGDSTVQIEAYTPTAGTTNLTVGPIISAYFGKFNSSAYATAFWVDDAAIEDAATGFIGVNAPPVVTAGTAQTVAAGAAFSLSFTATDPDGNAMTYTAVADAANPAALGTLTVGGTAPNKTVTGTAPATSGKYLVNVKASDGVSDSATVPLTLYVTSTTARAVGTGTTGWTPSAGTLAACLSDASQSSYATSPNNPTGEDLPVTMSPFAADATSCTVAYEFSADAATPARTLTVTLKQGATNVAAKTEATVTTSVVAGTLVLTSAQLATWSNRNDWSLVFTGN